MENFKNVRQLVVTRSQYYASIPISQQAHEILSDSMMVRTRTYNTHTERHTTTPWLRGDTRETRRNRLGPW